MLDIVRSTYQTMIIINVWTKIDFCVVVLCAVKQCGNATLLKRKCLLNETQKDRSCGHCVFCPSWDIPDHFASDLKECLLSINYIHMWQTQLACLQLHHNFLVPIQKICVIWHFNLKVIYSVQSWDTQFYGNSGHQLQCSPMLNQSVVHYCLCL